MKSESASTGSLIFFCGKMGAGKSTMATRLVSERENAILLSEDHWLTSLYSEDIHNFDDYLKYSARLKPLLTDHLIELLRTGVTVILDFPGNTARQRSWFRRIIDQSGAQHTLIYLEADDAVCLQHLKQRNREHPERSHFDTEEVFRQVTSHFEAPSAEEGFNIELK